MGWTLLPQLTLYFSHNIVFPQWNICNDGTIVDVQFNDLAIMEVSEWMLPCMLVYRKTNASFDMGRTFLPQFSPGEDDAIDKHNLLMQ